MKNSVIDVYVRSLQLLLRVLSVIRNQESVEEAIKIAEEAVENAKELKLLLMNTGLDIPCGDVESLEKHVEEAEREVEETLRKGDVKTALTIAVDTVDRVFAKLYESIKTLEEKTLSSS